jgi:serine/threonine protein kinase
MGKRVGQYTLLKEIDRGSFGVVYLAIDREGNEVAVKVIGLARLSAKEKARIEEEIQCMQKFQNPYVVRLIDHLTSPRNKYLVMELVKGGDLQGLLNSKLPISEQTAKRLIAQLVEAVKLLHTHRVIHRDLKPANILLTSRDLSEASIKIMDFGMSRNLINASMMAQTYVGSPLFMSPEVIRLDRYSFKADVWSLGAVSFEILTGREAFECGTARELEIKQMQPLTYPADCTISEEAKDFLRGLLTYDPDRRPSIEEVQSHPFLYEVPHADLPPPVAVRASTIIEEVSGEDAEDPALSAEQRLQNCSELVQRLESRVEESLETRFLAEDYERKGQLVVALYLFCFYALQQDSNFNEADCIQRDYSLKRKDSAAFNTLYEGIQDELLTTDAKMTSLQAQLNCGLQEIGLDGREPYSEALRIYQRGMLQQEDIHKMLLLLTALLLQKPEHQEAAVLIEEVRSSYDFLE